MANQANQKSIQKAARIAGLMYFMIIITSLLSMIVGPFKLMVEGDAEATFQNIKTNEFLFRAGAAYDLLMYASVVILAVALFAVLKRVSRNLALVALLWRLGEAVLGCLSVLCSLIILLLLNNKDYAAVFGSGQLPSLIGLLLDISSSVTSMVFVFLSLGTIVFCYLFYRSRYIPRVLAAFGILSFLLMLVITIVNILSPVSSFMVFGAPAILFEIIIGLWLLIKGVDMEYRENRIAGKQE